jgi:DNA-directed RNA polymerase subunit RPC12/RpoP
MTEPTHKTPPLIALQCPTCGASLQVASEKNQFACSHCGNRYLLDRKLQDLTEPEREHLKPNVTYTQHIQQWLRVGEYEVFLHSIGEETVQKKRVLYIEVAYRNVSGRDLTCRHDQWVVFDQDGYTYEPVKDYDFRALYESDARRYVGLSRVITPGMRLRGWLGFVLPDTALVAYLQFSGGIPAKTVEIELHLG